jgi:hypothetical protein
MSKARRRAVDRILLDGDDLTLSNPPGGAAAAARRCRPVHGSSVPGEELRVPESGLLVRPRGSRSALRVSARRFGDGFQRLGVPPGRGPLLLEPAAGEQVRPWLAKVSGGIVCSPR